MRSDFSLKYDTRSPGYSEFFQATVLQPTVICLIKRAACRLSDQFSSSYQEQGLVGSSHSSAAEFTTAVTDSLREQS